MTAPEKLASVRYLVDDVEAAVTFYTTHFGFTVHTSFAPAFADVIRGPLRLLLSGPTSSGARATPADATAAGRNRIHLVVDDLDTEIDRLRRAGLSFTQRPRHRPRRPPSPRCSGRPPPRCGWPLRRVR